MARLPFIGSGRRIEGGELATRKQDFNAHVDGTGFRHTAASVDVATIEGVAATNVQEALESVTDLITSAGSGFISIGLADGYGIDGYAPGSYTVGTLAYPTLRDAFQGAIADPRLTNGGVILVLAGTYKTSTTITIPSGITVMGEMSGTIIVGETPDTPMFQIEGTTNRLTVGQDMGSGSLPLDSSAKLEAIKFMNLTLIDNLDGYASFGQASMSTAPMIRVAVNSNFTCEFVRFIGRINNGSELGTAHAIRTQAASSAGTHLKLYKCFFDGINRAVYWTPGGGRLDSFVMDGCRARAFSLGESQASQNCFAVLTECNATVTNNEIHEGGIMTLEYCFVISESYNDGSSMTFTGNHGYGGARYSPIVAHDQGSTAPTFNAVLSGNSWGTSMGTGWYVVAGLDYVGNGALQTIINTGLDLGRTDVYLMPFNEFTVTTNGSSSLRLFSSDSSVRLNVSSGTDTGVSSNRRFDIRKASGITFKCYSTDSSNFHTVVVNYGSSNNNNNKITHIDRCKFIDCGLRFMEINTGTLENDSTEVRLSDCQFYQSGSFATNYSLLMPSASITVMENCKIHGGGYAGGIGESSTYDHNAATPTIIMRNCQLLGSGSDTIDTTSPIVGTNDYYWWINDSTANVFIENCQIQPTRPNSTLTSIDAYNKAIYLRGAQVRIENSNFFNNDNFFTASSINYQLPLLYVEPTSSLNVDKCNFSNSSLTLQVGGPGATLTTGATITNCVFNTNSDYSTTSIDFDIDLNSIPVPTPRIVIDGNLFYHSPGDGESYPVRHTEATGSFYDTLAGVMVYANLFDVYFTNNTLKSIIETGNFTKVAGVIIDNANSNTQSGALNTLTVFSGNKISVVSRYTGIEDMDALQADAVSIVTPALQMHDNYLSMYTESDLSDDVQNRIMTVNIDDAQGVTEGLITNNIFTTRTEDGSVGLLNSEFVYVTSGSAKARFTGNVFTDAVSGIVSGGTEEVDDNSTDGWLIYDNKRQRKSTIVLSSHGNFSAVDNGVLASSFNFAGYDGMGVSSRITGSSSTASDGNAVTFVYTDTGDTIRFSWLAQGMAIIPYGVTIRSISVDYTLSASASTRTLSVTIHSAAGTDTSSITIGGTTPSTLTKSVTMSHINTPENMVRFAVGALIEDAAPIDLDISNFTINYEW
jgi:hypothetical protein